MVGLFEIFGQEPEELHLWTRSGLVKQFSLNGKTKGSKRKEKV